MKHEEVCELKWREDPDVEIQLKQLAIKHQVVKIKVASIDEAWGHTHSGRLLEPVNKGRGQDYAEMMVMADAVFPRMLALKLGDDKYGLLGGNTRFFAVKLIGVDVVEVDLIEQTLSDDMCDLIPASLNRLHGERTDQDDAMGWAIKAIKDYKWPIQKAAELFHVKEESLKKYVKEKDVLSVLGSRGVPVSNIPQKTALELSKVNNNTVMVAIAEVVSRAKLTSDETSRIIKDVRKETNGEQAQLDKVSEFKKLYCPDKGSNGLSTLQRQVNSSVANDQKEFRRALTNFENKLKGKKTIKSLGFSDPDEAKEIKERLKALSERCNRIE